MLRKATEQLLAWKTKSNKVLIVRGARKTGKTYLIKEFAEDFYKNVVYVDFENNERMRLLFDSNPDFVRLKTAIQIETGTSISKEDTLIVLDGIDWVPGAEKVVSGFNDSGYSVIAISADVVGEGEKVADEITIYPMSFCEYLEAKGFKDLSELIFSRDWELKKVFSSKYIELMKEYIFVGGMPECVDSFIENGDFSKVRKIQKRILAEYEFSFFNLSLGKDIKKITALYDSVPKQIIRENNKFVYDKVKSGARAKEFEKSLELLVRTGVAARVNRITKPSLSLMSYTSNTFKMFMNDVGLLCAKIGIDYKELDSNNIFDSYNGALTQQFVWQQMVSAKVEPRYWSAYKGTSKMDFVVLCGRDIIPVETVGEENKKAKNMKVYLEKFSPKRAIRLSLSDYRNEEGFINVPLFAAEAIMEVCGGNIIQR